MQRLLEIQDDVTTQSTIEAAMPRQCCQAICGCAVMTDDTTRTVLPFIASET